jgi:hypothetical protein
MSEAAHVTRALAKHRAHPIQPAHERKPAPLAPLRTILGRTVDAKVSVAYPSTQKSSSTHAQAHGPSRTWGETMQALGRTIVRFSNAFRVYKRCPCTYTHQLPNFEPRVQFPSSPSLSTSQQRSQFPSQPAHSLHTSKSPPSSAPAISNRFPFLRTPHTCPSAPPEHLHAYGEPLRARAPLLRAISTCFCTLCDRTGIALRSRSTYGTPVHAHAFNSSTHSP